jgi:hypothetical protein
MLHEVPEIYLAAGRGRAPDLGAVAVQAEIVEVGQATAGYIALSK